jgi:serine/threonine-protein kinase
MIGHRVAIKLLRPEYAGNAELAARFLQEALAAAAIGHPGIVKVFDAGVGSDGRAYVVMEFLEGEDLQKLQTRQRRLAVADAAEIFVDVLDALAATHAAGIVHRDMKPENVFLARGPRGARVVKLLDFGVARLAEGSPQSLRLTRPGAVIGTPYYMAPEQARGKRPVDGAVDVYAVGVMLFESLCGRLPFTGGTHEAVLARVLSEPFPKARTFQPDLPAGLEAIIARATARQPAERFADAAEFARALAGFAPSRESAWRVPEPDGTPRVAPAIPPPPGTEAEAEVLVVDVGPAREAAPASPPPPPRRPSPAPVRTSTPPGTPVRVPTPARPPRRPASTPPPRHVVPSLGRQIAVFLTGAVVAAVLVLAGVLIGLRLREPEEAAGVAGAVGGAAGIVPAAAAPAQVRIRVLGAPPAAEIRFDGRPVAPDFSVPVAGDEHVLEVRVPDRPPLVRRVRPTADLTIDLAAASGPPPAP